MVAQHCSFLFFTPCLPSSIPPLSSQILDSTTCPSSEYGQSQLSSADHMFYSYSGTALFRFFSSVPLLFPCAVGPPSRPFASSTHGCDFEESLHPGDWQQLGEQQGVAVRREGGVMAGMGSTHSHPGTEGWA